MNSDRKELYLQRTRRLLPWLLIPFIALYIYAGMPNYTLPFIPSILQFRPYGWLNEFAFVLCYGYLVTAVLFGRPDKWLVRLFSWTPLRWLGLISYSLYIWHRPLTQILATNLGPSLRRLHPVLTFSLFWIITLTVIITYCFFLFILIEKPGMQLSEKLRHEIMQKTEKRPALSNPVNPYPRKLVDTITR